MPVTREEAVVSDIKDGFAHLNTHNTACESCSSQSGCSNFSFFPTSEKGSLKVANTLGLKEGDRVVVELKTDTLVFGTLLIYILPILSLLVFSGLGQMFWGEEPSIILGLLGFIVSLLVIRRLMLKKNLSKRFEPTILKKIIPVNLIG